MNSHPPGTNNGQQPGTVQMEKAEKISAIWTDKLAGTVKES